ncbi:MAG: hypothetical protein QOJ13_959 [Gaiellales bacterium]|jgi:hypothetical protein|nr:hypothetical protein [Gaiellales bacterium]
MATDWVAVAAVAGPLLGVVTGGVITTWSTWLLESRRAELQQAADAERERRRVVRAARLMVTELYLAEALFDSAVRADVRSAPAMLTVSAWEELRNDLADSTLTYDQWRQLSLAYGMLTTLKVGGTASIGTMSGLMDLTRRAREGLEDLLIGMDELVERMPSPAQAPAGDPAASAQTAPSDADVADEEPSE